MMHSLTYIELPVYYDDLKTAIRKSSRDLSTDYLINEEINDI